MFINMLLVDFYWLYIDSRHSIAIFNFFFFLISKNFIEKEYSMNTGSVQKEKYKETE